MIIIFPILIIIFILIFYIKYKEHKKQAHHTEVIFKLRMLHNIIYYFKQYKIHQETLRSLVIKYENDPKIKECLYHCLYLLDYHEIRFEEKELVDTVTWLLENDVDIPAVVYKFENNLSIDIYY